jgi:hypothetical protein
MADDVQFQIEVLDPKRHRREGFNCESAELTNFLKKQARREMEAKSSVCFVLTPVDCAGKIAGFYTLSAASLILSELPDRFTKKLPRYPQVPATLLGRLARDLAFKGSGIGPLLLRDAMARGLLHSVEIGSAFLLVDAKDARAAAFYARFGFLSLDESRMFLPMDEVRQWLT